MKLIFALVGLVVFSNASASIDPLSKINITSMRATCSKQGTPSKDMRIKYSDDVRVTLADDSKITSCELEVLCQLSSKKNNSQKSVASQAHASSQFKQVTFSKDVCLLREKLTVKADQATLDVATRVCTLTGNVEVIQGKKQASDVPATVKSGRAVVNLKTNTVIFEGSTSKPVQTVIDLAGHPILQQSKKKKRKKESSTS